MVEDFKLSYDAQGDPEHGCSGPGADRRSAAKMENTITEEKKWTGSSTEPAG